LAQAVFSPRARVFDLPFQTPVGLHTSTMVVEPGALDRQVVIDAGAAIKLQRLERFGGALYTTGGVLREIRDEHARALLETLPQELKVQEPSTEDVMLVKQFAKHTGDLGFLSQNDIELIALTVSLYKRNGGTVRERPAAIRSEQGHSAFDWAPGRPGIVKASLETPKVDVPTENTTSTNGAVVEASCDSGTKQSAEDEAPKTAEDEAAKPKDLTPGAERVLAGVDNTKAVDSVGRCDSNANAKGEVASACKADVEKDANSERKPEADEQAIETQESNGKDVASDSESEDGSSAGEWVTPENMHNFGVGVQPADDLKVTCATSDYSVQNVLLQMGITPLTFDGYAVQSVKLWGLVCRACFFFTRDTQKVFCPKCGNDTCVRVPVIVDQDGQATFLNNGRKLRSKGTVYSVPKPRGGRGWKPVFAEDELMMGGRDRELRHMQHLHDKDRLSRDPFNDDNGARAWYQRNTTNTGKMINGHGPRVQAGYGRQNPNANNFKFKGRKKR